MSVQIQYLRGSNIQLDAFTGAQAEILVGAVPAFSDGANWRSGFNRSILV